jgi:hypothetical protein
LLGKIPGLVSRVRRRPYTCRAGWNSQESGGVFFCLRSGGDGWYTGSELKPSRACVEVLARVLSSLKRTWLRSLWSFFGGIFLVFFLPVLVLVLLLVWLRAVWRHEWSIVGDFLGQKGGESLWWRFGDGA